MTHSDLLFKASEYPATFYDFSKGMDADHLINQFVADTINTAVRKLKANEILSESFATCSTGNLFVITEAYRQSNGKISVYVTVSQSHKRLTETEVDIK